MKCEEVLSHLPELDDGDLSPEVMASVQQHLSQCASCAAEQVALARTWEMLDAFPTVEVASDFNHRFWKRVEAEPVTFWQRVTNALRIFSKGPVRAIAVFAVMLIVVISSIPTPQPPIDVPPPLPPQDTASYNVMGDVADLAPIDDDASAVSTPAPQASETPIDQNVDRLLEELPLDSSGPQG